MDIFEPLSSSENTLIDVEQNLENFNNSFNVSSDNSLSIPENLLSADSSEENTDRLLTFDNVELTTNQSLDLEINSNDSQVSQEGSDPLTGIDDPETFEENSNNSDQVSDDIEVEPSEFGFESGIFTVGDEGSIDIDFLFDGGKHKGELAIFSLEDLNEEPGSEAFIKEAASRALSRSEFGHVVISDSEEGSRFSGVLGEHENENWNSGEHQDGKTFAMNPGDEFGILFVPNGKVQEVFDDPSLEGSKRPLFSMTTANPDDIFEEGLIADLTGCSHSFAMEDAWGPDKDYNDLLFEMRGATGDVVLVDDVIDSELDWRETELGQDLFDYIMPAPVYESGVFTIGESGEVDIDFLFDGGKWQGELAIFNLEGMEEYELGCKTFIEEAARRALSSSELGHVVISDPEEGARFTGILEGYEDEDWNNGEYQGIKGFEMTPGDEFGFMFIPNGTVEEVLENPDVEGSKRPLFSMTAVDSEDVYGLGTLVDVTGDRNSFGFDDQWGDPDGDYNDLVFQVNGATGTVESLSGLIEPENDWRNADPGQELIQSVVDPLDLAGNTLDEARRSGVASFGKPYRGWVGSIDPDDYYSFSLGASNQFSLSLDGLSADANVELLDIDGNVILSSTNPDNLSESINTTLSSGAYRLRVFPVGEVSTAYDLELTVTPLIAGVTTTGSEELYGLSTNQSLPLINLDDFQSGDINLGSRPEFAGIDGSGWSTVIIDTGIDLNHPFFGTDNDGNGVADRIVYHQDFRENDMNASDPANHGSHVSSIVASGDSITPGVAPGADIIHLKVFPDQVNSDGRRLAPAWATEQALQWVIENAAEENIASVNMSLGSGNYSEPTQRGGYSDELQTLADLGVIVVASSGNDYGNRNVQGVAYPSADPNVISVGAVYDANIGLERVDNDGDGIFESVASTTNADQIAAFSQRHATMTDVFAPGSRITGANATGGRVNMSGTSMAAPHITGMAVLAQQLAVQELGRRLTPSEFRSLINSTGVTITDGDDENDNVINTGLNFKRADMLALGQAIPDIQTVSVTINRTRGDFDPSLLNNKSDFYSVVSIADREERESPQVNGNDITPDWRFEEVVPGDINVVPIKIQIFDRDGFGRGRDDRADLNPNSSYYDDPGDGDDPNKDLNLDYNLITGAVSDQRTGEIYGYRGQQIYLKGDKKGEIWFTVDGIGIEELAPPPVTAVIHRVKGDFDRFRFNNSDFNSQISIAGDTWNSPTVGGDSDLRPNWQHSFYTTNQTVPVSIRLFDQDRGGNTSIDLNPNVGYEDLNLVYDQVTGLITDFLTGQVYGSRGQLIYLKGQGDGNEGEIWFSIYGPPQ